MLNLASNTPDLIPSDELFHAAIALKDAVNGILGAPKRKKREFFELVRTLDSVGMIVSSSKHICTPQKERASRKRDPNLAMRFL